MADMKDPEQQTFEFDRPRRRLLTIPEAASALAIGRSALYELIKAGRIEVVHLGRAARIPCEAVDAFVAALRTVG